MSSEITAEKIEDVFGKHSDSVRFANFCNAVVIAEGSASVTTIPILSEKPGADGGIDGEWTVPADVSSDSKSPFGLPGWNVFQYKARSITGEGRQRAFSNLYNNVKGALAKLLNRLSQPKHCCQYALFTNLQLGVETTTQTPDGALLQKQRTQLAEAIAEGSDGKTPIKIFDAAQLAGFVNAHPALRLTYFSGPVAKSWIEAWEAEQRVKDYKISVPLIGRNAELKQLTEWLQNSDTKVIVLCGPSGMGKTRLRNLRQRKTIQCESYLRLSARTVADGSWREWSRLTFQKHQLFGITSLAKMDHSKPAIKYLVPLTTLTV
jgi:hypothetical protein